MPRGVKKVVEEPVEEIKVEQEVAAEVAEVAAEEPAVEASEEVAAAEEPAAVEEAPVVEEAPAVEEVAAAEEPAVESENKSAAKEVVATEGEWTFVDHLRIYPNNADRNIRTSVITGNIRVVGEQDGFKKIQYLKHGFGIVEALTDALN